MKKIIFTLLFASAYVTINAQTEPTANITNEPYNKWSVELTGGFNKPQNHITSGYFFRLISPYTVDLGLRYMFNNKFGLKFDAAYNSLQNKPNTPEFDAKYYNVNLQGVANLGRIMHFENWTNTIGLLGHTGLGLGLIEGDGQNYSDVVGNFILGFTPQIKLTERLSLMSDVNLILNARQEINYDTHSLVGPAGFNSIFFTGTIGFSYSLGKNAKHADWVIVQDDKVLDLEKRVSDLEVMNNDTDRDGVVDYLDLEPNTMNGVMVDSKGRAIDLNKNNIPDEIEKYVDSKYKSNSPTNNLNSDVIKELVNGGYISVFFDFNKITPNSDSIDSISYVLNYLRNNPSTSVDIVGHADEIGSTEYNNKLSETRANNVKNILLQSGLAASRLNIIAAGEDTSVDKTSDEARKLVRRVTFKLK